MGATGGQQGRFGLLGPIKDGADQGQLALLHMQGRLGGQASQAEADLVYHELRPWAHSRDQQLQGWQIWCGQVVLLVVHLDLAPLCEPSKS